MINYYLPPAPPPELLLSPWPWSWPACDSEDSETTVAPAFLSCTLGIVYSTPSTVAVTVTTDSIIVVTGLNVTVVWAW